MPVAGGGFEQTYNAQVRSLRALMLVVVPSVTQTYDKEQVLPVLKQLALPASLGQPEGARGGHGI